MTRIIPTLLCTLLMSTSAISQAAPITPADAAAATAPRLSNLAPSFANSEWQVTVYFECAGDPIYLYWTIHEKHQLTALFGNWPEQYEVQGAWHKGGQSVSIYLADGGAFQGRLKKQQTVMSGDYFYDNGAYGCWSAVRQ